MYSMGDIRGGASAKLAGFLSTLSYVSTCSSMLWLTGQDGLLDEVGVRRPELPDEDVLCEPFDFGKRSSGLEYLVLSAGLPLLRPKAAERVAFFLPDGAAAPVDASESACSIRSLRFSSSLASPLVNAGLRDSGMGGSGGTGGASDFALVKRLNALSPLLGLLGMILLATLSSSRSSSSLSKLY